MYTTTTKNYDFQCTSYYCRLIISHRTINSFELQELLDACLPNDYIKSCASIDICRQVVSLLDVSKFSRNETEMN